MFSIKEMIMETNNDVTEDLKTQITSALNILDKKEVNQVKWFNYEHNCSFIISINDDILIVSIGDTNQIVNVKAKQIVKDMLGSPDQEYTQKSMLNKGLYLHYMFWETESKVC